MSTVFARGAAAASPPLSKVISFFQVSRIEVVGEMIVGASFLWGVVHLQSVQSLSSTSNLLAFSSFSQATNQRA